ncbi:hypothetical protein D3C71_572580 [compost metagenome]
MGSNSRRLTVSALQAARLWPEASRRSSRRRPISPTTRILGGASLGCSNTICRLESSSALSTLNGRGMGQTSAHFSSCSPSNATRSVDDGTTSNGRATPVRSKGLPLMRRCRRGWTSISVAYPNVEMNGTPTPSSSTTCLRPVTLSSSVMVPPSITMLLSEKRGSPSSGLGGSSGLAAVNSATRCSISEKLKRVTSSRTMAMLGWRRVSRSTTGANQNSEVHAALASSSASVISGVGEPGWATARSRARTVSVKGLNVILPTETSRPIILETSWVRTSCRTFGTCQAATPHSISKNARMPRRILPARRVNRSLGMRTGIAGLLITDEGHFSVLPLTTGAIIAPPFTARLS